MTRRESIRALNQTRRDILDTLYEDKVIDSDTRTENYDLLKLETLMEINETLAIISDYLEKDFENKDG